MIKCKIEKHSIVDGEDKPYPEYQSNPSVWTTSSAPLPQKTSQQLGGFDGNANQQWGRIEWKSNQKLGGFKANSNQQLRDFEAKSNQQLRDFEAKSNQQLKDFEANSNLQLRGFEANSNQQLRGFETNSTYQSPITNCNTKKHSIVDGENKPYPEYQSNPSLWTTSSAPLPQNTDQQGGFKDDEDKPYSEYQSNPSVWTTSSAPLPQITDQQGGFKGNANQQWDRSEGNSNQQLSGLKSYPQNQQFGGFIANPQNPYIVAPEQMTMDERPPHDFMNRAICVTICCFWPTGIVAILKASEARNAYARGDIEAAKRSTHEAHQMSNISILIGLASFLLVLIIVGILIGTGN